MLIAWMAAKLLAKLSQARLARYLISRRHNYLLDARRFIRFALKVSKLISVSLSLAVCVKRERKQQQNRSRKIGSEMRNRH